MYVKINSKHFTLLHLHRLRERFIPYNTFNLRVRPKTWLQRPHMASGCFLKVFYETSTCPRLPLLSGLMSGFLILVWLYLNLNKSPSWFLSWFSSGISLTAFYLVKRFITAIKIKIHCDWFNVNRDLLSIYDSCSKSACHWCCREQLTWITGKNQKIFINDWQELSNECFLKLLRSQILFFSSHG